ncbi:MAG: hypothetical protein ACE5F1_06560 [Planctomycetota bacterium]
MKHEGGGFTEPVELLDLGRISADPGRMIAAELDDRPGAELAYVVPGEGLKVLFADAKGGFRPAGKKPAGFTQKMEDGSLSLTRDRGRWREDGTQLGVISAGTGSRLAGRSHPIAGMTRAPRGSPTPRQ